MMKMKVVIKFKKLILKEKLLKNNITNDYYNEC